VKQWLAYLRAYFPQAALLFERVKRLRDPTQLHAVLLAESQLACTDLDIPATA
jgi:tRNA-dihydrouridine synthase C